MKIAMVSPTITPNISFEGTVGGAETYAINLAIEMSKLNHDMTLITASKNSEANYRFNEHLEIKSFKTNAIGSLTLNKSGGPDPFSSKVISLIKSENYDLVHVHQIFSSFNSIACAMARLRKVPSFGTDHGGGSILWRVFPKVSAMLPKSFVAVSNFSLNYLNQLDSKRTSMVAYGGVNTDFFNPKYDVSDLRKKMNLECSKVILCVGRVLPSKGIDLVIRALYHLPVNTKLLIVGPTLNQPYFIHYSNYLRNLAQPLSNRVIFVGYVDPLLLPKFYNLSDVFVQASVTTDCFGHRYKFSELLGLVKFEAMACAKPVVVSNVGGLPEQVVHGTHGLIVREGKELELAKAIGTILEDESTCKRMGQRSLEFIQKNFTWRRVAERITDFYAANQ